MLPYLKTQELEDCLQCFGILSRNAYCPTTVDFCEAVRYLICQFLHDWHSRWSLIVNQHWRIKVAGGKHLRDVTEMHSDLVAALCVRITVCSHFYRTAIHEQTKMMRRLHVIKAHYMIASLIHLIIRHVAHVGSIVILRLLLSRSDQDRRCEHNAQGNRCCVDLSFHNFPL